MIWPPPLLLLQLQDDGGLDREHKAGPQLFEDPQGQELHPQLVGHGHC